MWKGKICKKARKDAMIKLKFSFSPLYVNTKIRARGHQLLFGIYYTHFEITGGPCNLIGSN